MTADEVERILDRVRAGDTAAYGSIVRAYQHELWRVAAFALRRTDETEDLVQQSFVLAYQRLDSFERGRDFGSWLRGIARNLVREQLRRRARDDHKNRRYLVHMRLLGEDESAAYERERALRAALADCREHLSEPAQQALRLRYEDALDFEAVAQTIGRTVSAARQLLQRARGELRHCIEGKVT